MPLVSEHKCNVCDFSLPTGWGGYTYVTDENGTRVVCPHPMESHTVDSVLKKSNPETIPEFEFYRKLSYGVRKKWSILKARILYQDHENILDLGEMIKQRTGFNSFCVCHVCLHQFEIDFKRDQRLCPICSSSRISSVRELIGKSCPKCDEGEILQHRRGIS